MEDRAANLRRIKEEARNKPQSYGIRKVSEKKKATVKEQLELANKDMDVYLSIWRKREHKCFETGQFLGNKFRKWHFHHCLPKAQFPQYRHEDWNLVLVTLETHSQAESDLSKTPKIKAYTESLKLKLGL